MVAKSAPKSVKPPLLDPHHVAEMFANEFVSAEARPGIWSLTFATKRLVDRREKERPRLERVVTARLVLTHEAMREMMDQLVRLNQALQKQAALAKSAAKATEHTPPK